MVAAIRYHLSNRELLRFTHTCSCEVAGTTRDISGLGRVMRGLVFLLWASIAHSQSTPPGDAPYIPTKLDWATGGRLSAA